MIGLFLFRLVLTPMLLAAVAVAGWLYLPAVGQVSATDLSYSLAAEARGSADAVTLAPCRPAKGRSWTCRVDDLEGSGVARYVVALRGRCWEARKLTANAAEEGPKHLPRFASRCVTLRDQARIGYRLRNAL